MLQRLNYHLRHLHYRQLRRQLAIFIALLILQPAQAICSDIIVSSHNPYNSLSRKELLAIYTMRQRYWPNGTAITVYMLTDLQSHQAFCKQRLKVFPHQLRSRWDRLIYSGTGIAPNEVHSEAEMISKIEQNPGSIGYTNKVTHNDDIKTITIH